MIDYAREQLNKYQLPAAFCPPYDPTLKMGALNIAKSRVMDSKKVCMKLIILTKIWPIRGQYLSFRKEVHSWLLASEYSAAPVTAL